MSIFSVVIFSPLHMDGEIGEKLATVKISQCVVSTQVVLIVNGL